MKGTFVASTVEFWDQKTVTWVENLALMAANSVVQKDMLNKMVWSKACELVDRVVERMATLTAGSKESETI